MALLTSLLNSALGGGGLDYQGSWNAATNTPTLASGVGINGYYYVVSVAGTTTLDGISSWAVGDWVIFNGSVWQKIDNSELWTDDGTKITPTNVGVNIDAAAAKFIAGSNTEIYESSGDTYIENTSATKSILKKLGDAAGATFSKVLDSAAAVLFSVASNGVIQAGKAGEDGYVDVKDSSNTVKNRLNSNGDSFINGGDVGIGTETPDELLEVYNGNIKVGYATDTFSELIQFFRNDIKIGAVSSTANQFYISAATNKTLNLTDDNGDGIKVLDGGDFQVSKNAIFDGGITRNVTTVNAATYDLLVSDDILNVTYTGTGAVTSLTLPTAQVVTGRTIVIKDAAGNAGTNSITVDTEGSEKIDGQDTAVINGDYDSITIYSDGTNWFIV